MSESNGHPAVSGAARRNSGGLRNRGLPARIGLDPADTDKRLECSGTLGQCQLPILPEIVEMAGWKR